MLKSVILEIKIEINLKDCWRWPKTWVVANFSLLILIVVVFGLANVLVVEDGGLRMVWLQRCECCKEKEVRTGWVC